MKTIFDSQIQSFDDRRLIFWILGINTPISYCVKKNWSKGAPSLQKQLIGLTDVLFVIEIVGVALTRVRYGRGNWQRFYHAIFKDMMFNEVR